VAWPRIDVWYGLRQPVGLHGRPQPVFNLLGRITAGSSAVYSPALSIPGDQMRPLPLGPTALRLRSPGDFNAEIPLERLQPGLNTVTLIATDEAGGHTRLPIELDYTPGRTWPVPYEVTWAQAQNIQDVAQVIDGHWALSPAGVRPVVTGYDRLIAIGDMSWTNYEISVPITIHGYDTFPGHFMWPSYGPAVGVLLGWPGHQDWGDILPRRGWFPFGALGIFRWRDGRMRRELWGGVGGQLIATAEPTEEPLLETPYLFKLDVRSRPGDTNYYRIKIYPASAPEPDSWDLEGPGTVGETPTGAAVLLAHHTAATFGNVCITPVTSS
jgi:hypothetical protein